MWSNENAASEEHFRTRAKSGILLDALNDCSLTGGFDHSFLHLFSCCLQSYPVWKCGVWFTSTKEGQLHSEGRNGQSLSSSLCVDLEWFWSSCSGESQVTDSRATPLTPEKGKADLLQSGFIVTELEMNFPRDCVVQGYLCANPSTSPICAHFEPSGSSYRPGAIPWNTKIFSSGCWRNSAFI